MEETLRSLIKTGTDFGLKLLAAVLVLIVGIRLSKHFAKRMQKSKALAPLDAGVQKFIVNAIKVALYTVVIISAAGILGIPYASFVAVLGSAGVAIGLALQGSLSNIASGILILINKPFQVGDFIESDNALGTVSEIGFFTTAITTIDNKVIHFPNAALAGARITNYTKNDKRRVDLEFSVGYPSDIQTVKDILLAKMQAHPLTLDDPAPVARLLKHGDSALVFVARVWCKTPDYWDVYFDLMEGVKAAFDQNGIEIPYAKLDVQITQKAEDKN